MLSQTSEVHILWKMQPLNWDTVKDFQSTKMKHSYYYEWEKIWIKTSRLLSKTVKAIAHWVRNLRMCFSVFSYSPPFPIKMHATDAKTQKIEPDLNFFRWTKVSEAVCRRDWHNVRSYLFFNVRKCRTQCAETFSLQLVKSLCHHKCHRSCDCHLVASQSPEMRT